MILKSITKGHECKFSIDFEKLILNTEGLRAQIYKRQEEIDLIKKEKEQ
jgi:hypothetical protein